MESRIVYSFDFTGVEDDELVKKFCWVFPTFPVTGKMNVIDPKFINKLKKHQISTTSMVDVLDSFYQIKELSEPFVDWGFIMYHGGGLDRALGKYGKDDESEEKIRLVHHLVNTYVVETHIIKSPDTRVRFALKGSDKFITLKDICDLLNK